MRSIKIRFCLMIINNFLIGTRFFKIKRNLLKIAGVSVGHNTKVVGPIYFGPKINIQFGENCWIGKNLNLDGNGFVKIENNVDIAPHVVINTGGHIIGSEERRAGQGISSSIRIGVGTWIGTRVTIINQVNIEQGVVIAAGSVVKDSIPENVLVAGVPAKIKKYLN
ncbi:acyltransferase [Cytobacillus sp. FJAT-54145]|uniref:Acyltransferase n=1 Tax=Cytobacillus spartinae TaxID=3299023 RepID=A0ABW6KFT5_9BACI